MTYKDGINILKAIYNYTINSTRTTFLYPFSFLYIAHAYYEGWLDNGNKRATWKEVIEDPNSYDPIHNDYEVIPVQDPLKNLHDFYYNNHNLLIIHSIASGLSDILAEFDKKRQSFLEIYNQLSEVPFSWWKKNWTMAFDELLFYIVESQGRYIGEHTQPIEITRLIGILELCYCGENNKKYDPFAGLGFFLNKGSYGGEINEAIYSLGNLRMMANGYQFEDSRNYVKVDSTKYWGCGYFEVPYFDSIISFPPINLRIPYDNSMNIGDYGKTISVEDFFILKGLQSLKPGGHIIGVFSNSILFAEGTKKNLRKDLILNGRVKMVIQLPANLLYGSSIPLCVVVISKDSNIQNDTIFIDASSLYTKENRKNVLNTRDISGIIFNILNFNITTKDDLNELLKENFVCSIDSQNINKYAIKVSNDVIVANNYNLSPSRYFINTIEVPEGYTSHKLGEITTIYSNKQTELNEFRLIRGGNLSVTDTIEYRTFEDLPLESSNSKGCLLTEDAIIVQKIRNLKPTLFRYKENLQVAISSNLYAIIPNDVIDPYYLVSELKKPYVTEQVYNLCQGAVMPSLTVHDLASIRILIPGDRETQHAEFLKAQKQDVTEYIQRERERISEMMRINRHRINPYISGLQSNVSMLLDEIKATGKLEPDCLLSRDYTILDALENMKENLKHIKSLFDEFTIDKNIGVIESFDLIHFLKDYSYNQTMPDKHFVLDKSQLNTKEKYPLILFNKANLGEVLEEIIHNAEKHLITGAKENRIAFVPRFDGKNVSLLICNNGEPLPADFDEERSFAPGYHKDEKGTGLGLYRVRKVCSEFGANIKWDNDPDNFMPTGLCITFKLS